MIGEKEYDIVPEVDFNLASRFERILRRLTNKRDVER